MSVLLVSPVNATKAANNLVSLSSLEVNTTLNEDGSIHVEQILKSYQSFSLNWQLFSEARNLSVDNGSGLVTKSVKQNGNSSGILLTTSDKSTVWKIYYTTTSKLMRHDQRDLFFLKLFDAPGRYIGSVTATFQLPKPGAVGELNGNIYGINGIEDPITTPEGLDKISYFLSSAGPNSLATINASWPKSILALSTIQELKLRFMNLDIIPWIILGIILPLISLIILLALLYREKKSLRKVTEEITKPPSKISPLIAGVIVNKKIYSEELVAMIVDLCQRGYLIIFKRDQKFYLSKRRDLSTLQEFERNIMEQLFLGARVVSKDEVELINKRMLFSPMIKKAFSDVYETITKMNYFTENPHFSRVKYKLVALLIYFLSIISLLWVVITNESSYLIIPLTGTILISYLIIRLSPQLVHYTKNGLAARFSWMAFGNYLKSPEAMPLEASMNRAYEKYLPYAIALHLEKEWGSRFRKEFITVPDWIICYEDRSTTEFTKEIIEFGNVISKFINGMRGPSVN